MAQEPQQIIPNEDLPKLAVDKIAQEKQKYVCGMIYKVVNKNDPDEFYIGSTKNKLRMRWDGHKRDARLNKVLGCQLHERMREIGHESFQIVLVEEWPCDNRDQLRQREDHWITTLRPCLNTKRAFVSAEDMAAWYKNYREENADKIKQYRQDNASHIAARKQELYQENRQQVLEERKEYYEQNTEAVRERVQQYRRNNPEKVREAQRRWAEANKAACLIKRKEYYLKNQAAILLKKRETTRCEICNLDINKSKIRHHERSQKHKDNMPAPVVPAEQA